MPNDKVKPFLAGQRRDILRSLVATGNEAVHQSIIEKVSKAMKPEIPKIDGKAGGLDGSSSIGFGNDVAYGSKNIDDVAYVPKSIKEGKDKEQSDKGKDKDKESSDKGKDKDKESSDGFKTSGDEMQNPFTRFGEVQQIPYESLNAIGQAFPDLLKSAIARGSAQ